MDVYVNKSDQIEWEESYEMIQSGEETVLSELSIGQHVIIKQILFKQMIQEINDFRLKYGNIREGVELIVLEESNEKNSEIGGES